MRKFTCCLMLLFSTLALKAQLTFEAATRYGKLWDITYDATIPNRIYGLTSANHLMVSGDNGANWSILYTYPNDEAYLTQLKLRPGGTALSFVVKNLEPEKNGLYIFDLATDTITRKFTLPSAEAYTTIVSYSVYDDKDSIVLINTSFQKNFKTYSKIFYTTDAGFYWKPVYNSSGYDDVLINNAAIDPTDPNLLILMRSGGTAKVDGGLFISHDAGDTWKVKLNGKALHPMAFNPTNAQDIWVGTSTDFNPADEALYHSIDGGDTWDTLTNLPLHTGGLNEFTHIAFDPNDAQKIWVLEDNEYLKTADGGAHWESFFFPPDDDVYDFGSNITINPHNSKQVFICSDGWPQYSKDDGVTLTQVKNPFYTVTNVAFANYGASQHLYYDSHGGYLEKNLATGATKHYLIESEFIVNGHTRTVIADTAVDGRVFVYTPGDGFISTSTLAISDDYGASLKTLPCDDFSSAIEKIRKDPNDANTYWISYADFDMGTLFKVNIQDINNPVSTPITTPGFERIAGVYVLPGSSDSVLITQGTKVYVTGDGGTTWQLMSKGIKGLTDGVDLFTGLESNPFNPYQLIASSTRGCYLSSNGGKTWAKILGNANVGKASFSSAFNGDIVAVQYSYASDECRLYYSTNDGNTWTNVPATAFSNLQSDKVDFNFFGDSINVYFATIDVGVAKYQIKDLRGTLPLHLLSFTGAVKNDNALLQWSTTAEQDLKAYELQRSKDGRNFGALHTTAAVNAPGNYSYNYTDEDFAPYAGKENNPVYYRLKMMDIDGHYSYSNTIKLARTGTLVEDVTVYPNPVVNTVNLQLRTGSGGNYVVKIVDANGRQYYSSTRTLSAGTSTVGIPVTNLAKGVYMVTIQSADGKTTTMKFVK